MVKAARREMQHVKEGIKVWTRKGTEDEVGRAEQTLTCHPQSAQKGGCMASLGPGLRATTFAAHTSGAAKVDANRHDICAELLLWPDIQYT